MKRFAAGADSTLSQTVWTRDPPPSGTWAKDTTTPSSWTRDHFIAATWQTPPTPPFIRVTMESTGGDRIRITEDGAIRIIAYELVGPWLRADFADAVWTKE